MRRLRRCWLLSIVAMSLILLLLLSAFRNIVINDGESDGGSDGRSSGSSGDGRAVPPNPQANSGFDHLPATCTGQRPCIGFGTPYFSQWSGWLPYVRQWFDSAQAACGVACDVVSDQHQADAVMFHGRDLQPTPPALQRSPRQHWVYVNMESPLATQRYGYDVSSNEKYRFLFNWTATTMLTSSVHQPYGIWDRRKQPVEGPFYVPEKKRHMAYVAFSNCKSSFNNRTAKVAFLRQFIDVHVYGECGDLPLGKEWNVWRKISEQYRFYLSFENALCRDYLTEKFHNNGLDSQAVPVVFGGLSRADYERVSPPRSFVYALDFPSMQQLAEHLKSLAADEARYASHFEWKRQFQVSPRTALLCGVCSRLHRNRSNSVEDLSSFYDLQRNCRPANYAYLT